MRGGGAFRRASLAEALCLTAGQALAWEVRAPVVAAEPVYAAAARSSCDEPEAGPVLAPDLADALAADLDLAACAPPGRTIVGWNVRYRFDGREYRTFTADHPGDTLAVNVRVQSTSSSPGRRASPATRVRIRR